jgi:hypothetical protein
MVNSPLAKKLHINAGQRITIINPPEGYMKLLGEFPEGVEFEKKPKGELDFVHLFVKNISELEKFGPKALEAIKYDGILWISYPKKSSKIDTDISRDAGWDIITKNGLRAIASVAINDVWSALRFRPIERVKSSKK